MRRNRTSKLTLRKHNLRELTLAEQQLYGARAQISDADFYSLCASDCISCRITLCQTCLPDESDA